MAHQDFFTFSTSLSPIELKAIGHLSSVRHFQAGEIIYATGDEGTDLYIVNRGAVELFPKATKAKAPPTVLQRGDIFGVLGALLQLPRDHAARACSALSVQCFHRRDFDELLKKVPSFFLYLLSKLARRLFLEQEITHAPNDALELTGLLAHFDVPTIYQTIRHSKQTGLLTFTDARGKQIAEFYFVEGAPRRGRFEHLVGAEAFWQLFQRDELATTFSFSNNAPDDLSAAAEEAIVQNPDALLIRAIHMRDEFNELRRRLLDRTVALKRTADEFHWENPEFEQLRPLAQLVAQLTSKDEVTLGDLHRAVDYSDLKIYQVVNEMVRLGLIELGLPAKERMLVAM